MKTCLRSTAGVINFFSSLVVTYGVNNPLKFSRSVIKIKIGKKSIKKRVWEIFYCPFF